MNAKDNINVSLSVFIALNSSQAVPHKTRPFRLGIQDGWEGRGDRRFDR